LEETEKQKTGALEKAEAKIKAFQDLQAK